MNSVIAPSAPCQTPHWSVCLLQCLRGVWEGILRLFFYRFSLKEKRQRDAFEVRQQDGSVFSREEWLRDFFSRQFTFTHRSNEFFFVPERPEVSGVSPDLVAGWVARDRDQEERTPPWEGLAPTKHQSWRAALLLLDPREHSDGQKLALEYRADVGGTDPIMASLAQHMSAAPEYPFSVAAYPIIEAQSFARFASEHKGAIKSITYDVAVPNMFSSPDDFSAELASLRDTGNVARVLTRLESDGAINTDASQLDEIAEHVERGGGKITAKTRTGKIYRSDDHKVSEIIETSDDEPESQGLSRSLR